MPRPTTPSRNRQKRPAPHASDRRGGSERLHKVLAAAGVASRRACETLIEKGKVAVNGQQVTTMPTLVDPQTDRIEVEGRPISTHSSGRQKKWYVVVHKPRLVVSTCHDPQGRRCVVDLVDLPTRLYPVGRLDADSSGLMLLTNDGTLSCRLTHPRYEVPKQYRISVRGHVNRDDLDRLKSGLFLAHRRGQKDHHAKRAAAARVQLIGYSRDRASGERTNLSVTLREGQNRQIRRLLARLGYKVRRLERTAIGPITLKGLATGQWRPLAGREINALRRAAGLG